MDYNVVSSRNFENEFKRLFKKYPSLKKDFYKLETELKNGESFGASIGKNAFKIRLAVKSKGKGKRGGLRVITYLESHFIIKDMTTVFMISIYDKSETASLSNSEIKKLIESRNQ
ncbi:MAG: hypothetical protein ABIT08_07220 [Bacteroidia bacterium]